MSTPTPSARRARRTARPPEGRPRRDGFRQLLTEYVTNKAMITFASLRNDGDKKKGIPGIKASLLQHVMEHGEKDPDSGSYFLDIDEPIVLDTGEVYRRVKAERRQSAPALDPARAREWLEEHDLLEKVEEYRYVLRLDGETAAMFGEWLTETGLIERVESTDAVLVEDNLLALHHQRTGAGKAAKRVLPEEVLDSFYVTPEPIWAFIPLTK